MRGLTGRVCLRPGRVSACACACALAARVRASACITVGGGHEVRRVLTRAGVCSRAGNGATRRPRWRLQVHVSLEGPPGEPR